LILPRKGIALLGLLLAASLCSAQDQPKTGKNVQPAVLIHYVKPDYPDAWKREGIQGTVHLHAIITKEGNVQNVTVIDGDARLAKCKRQPRAVLTAGYVNRVGSVARFQGRSSSMWLMG
jgi:hypothetical protein